MTGEEMIEIMEKNKKKHMDKLKALVEDKAKTETTLYLAKRPEYMYYLGEILESDSQRDDYISVISEKLSGLYSMIEEEEQVICRLVKRIEFQRLLLELG